MEHPIQKVIDSFNAGKIPGYTDNELEYYLKLCVMTPNDPYTHRMGDMISRAIIAEQQRRQNLSLGALIESLNKITANQLEQITSLTKLSENQLQQIAALTNVSKHQLEMAQTLVQEARDAKELNTKLFAMTAVLAVFTVVLAYPIICDGVRWFMHLFGYRH